MDFDKIKRNIQKMGEQGATEQEIDAYISGEGVTAEQLRSHKNSAPEGFKGLFNAIPAVRAFNSVSKGNVDPEFKDLEGFKAQGLFGSKESINNIVNPIERAKMTTLSDEGFGNIVKKSLGDRLLSAQKDKFGQEIVTYQGDDGQPIQTYINKPGLDGQDVDRFVAGALPFVAGAGLVNNFSRIAGLGLKGRVAAQGITAGAVDSGLQTQGQEQGSGEEFDLGRTALAAAGGAGGELIGSIATRLIQGNGLLDKATGKLTEKGKQWARANKIDPEAIDPQISAYLSQNIPKAADANELAIQARALEFDIPTSKAQRTKSPTHAFNELQMEKGIMGRDAERSMKNFKEGQIESIERAAMDDVGKGIAPDAPGVEKATLGEAVGDEVNSIFNYLKKEENKFWSDIGPMFPKEGAFESLPKIISKKADKAGIRLLPRGTEASAEMYKTMQRFMHGDLKSEGAGVLTLRSNDNVVAKKGSLSDFLLNTGKGDNIPAVNLFDDYNAHRVANGLPEKSIEEIGDEIKKAGLKPERIAGRIRYNLSGMKATNNTIGLTDKSGAGVLSIDEARRMLLGLKNSAEPGSRDARLANHLYEGFNDWIDDAAKKALVQSDDPAAYAALKTAREFTKKIKAMFEPKDKNGKLTPGGKRIQQIIGDYETPEGVISSIFGKAGPTAELPNGTVQVLNHLKGLGRELGNKNTLFDSLKMAYWVTLVQGKEGKVLSPNMIRKNLDIAMNNHKSAFGIMFDKKERDLIKRFRVVMNDLHVEHPNPSLSSIGIGHMAKSLGKQALQTQSKRELFSKHNVLMSRIYAAIAKSFDTPLFNPGRKLARGQTSQKITTRSKNNIGIMGGLGAVSAGNTSQ